MPFGDAFLGNMPFGVSFLGNMPFGDAFLCDTILALVGLAKPGGDTTLRSFELIGHGCQWPTGPKDPAIPGGGCSGIGPLGMAVVAASCLVSRLPCCVVVGCASIFAALVSDVTKVEGDRTVACG